MEQIIKACESFSERNAFFTGEQYYTYREFAAAIAAVVEQVHERNSLIGLISEDDFATYASLFGILFSGNGFVPINPDSPPERNLQIIRQAGIRTILSSRPFKSQNELVEVGLRCVFTGNLPPAKTVPALPGVSEESTAYIIFTSGSTGIPKGVPITRKNISAFINAFFDYFGNIDERDSFLQMYDLTFDASVMHYLPALCRGACVYTVPRHEIKYLYAYKLLSEHPISFSLLMPSTLNYLRPYFKKIRLNDLRYSLFGGEAVFQQIIQEWSDCVPNARIFNAYGPTEASIFFMIYEWDPAKSGRKAFNGMVPIGKPMKDTVVALVDENLNPVTGKGATGELVMAGPQLTPGYLNQPGKNRETFFTMEYQGESGRFYRTGDLAFKDEEGDYMFCGRADNQVQIQGFRVELGEIEHHARKFTKIPNVAAVAFQNEVGSVQIHLFLESYSGKKKEVNEYLKAKLPSYMIPAGISSLEQLPVSSNGKIDRKALARLAENLH
ncbi:MAG: amino acid adenylation domain-containing protein [Bacteroidales bacterium]|nr:amino acid adenylation domain-containing protein [Bacteroidales bacterium]